MIFTNSKWMKNIFWIFYNWRHKIIMPNFLIQIYNFDSRSMEGYFKRASQLSKISIFVAIRYVLVFFKNLFISYFSQCFFNYIFRHMIYQRA